MALFTSDRERRLWLWLLVVLVAIWSTLGLAGALVGVLRDRRLLDAAFILGLLVTMATITAVALRERPGGREVWVSLGIAAAYGMVVVRMGIPVAERTHLFEYGLVAALLFQALSERFRGGRSLWAPAALAAGVTALLGWVDEAIQVLLPNRVYDIRDVGFNALAGLMAIGASLALAWMRRWLPPGRDR